MNTKIHTETITPQVLDRRFEAYVRVRDEMTRARLLEGMVLRYSEDNLRAWRKGSRDIYITEAAQKMSEVMRNVLDDPSVVKCSLSGYMSSRFRTIYSDLKIRRGRESLPLTSDGGLVMVTVTTPQKVLQGRERRKGMRELVGKILEHAASTNGKHEQVFLEWAASVMSKGNGWGVEGVDGSGKALALKFELSVSNVGCILHRIKKELVQKHEDQALSLRLLTRRTR